MIKYTFIFARGEILVLFSKLEYNKYSNKEICLDFSIVPHHNIYHELKKRLCEEDL